MNRQTKKKRRQTRGPIGTSETEYIGQIPTLQQNAKHSAVAERGSLRRQDRGHRGPTGTGVKPFHPLRGDTSTWCRGSLTQKQAPPISSDLR